MKIIIAGAGNVGTHLAKLLSRAFNPINANIMAIIAIKR